MKKVGAFYMVVFVLVSFLFAGKQVYAVGLLNDFAGQIVAKKANRIRILEGTGYKCVVPGKTIQIVKVGVSGYEPLSYFIPFNTLAQWPTPIGVGKQILGQYSFKTPIVCTNGSSTQVVRLPTVVVFSTPEI